MVRNSIRRSLSGEMNNFQTFYLRNESHEVSYRYIFIHSWFDSFAAEPCNKKKCRPVPGSNTAVITISVDEQGNPLPSVTELLQLKPGQRIVFTGPEEFVIFFKDQKTPFKKSEFKSKDGVVAVKNSRKNLRR